MAHEIESPIVSIIVSVYKSERFIRGKLADIFQQSIINSCEVIIINSGSPENEDSIISEYAQQHANIVYIRTPERETIYKAWNRGVQIARGKYIANSNTDDRSNPRALEVMVRYLEEHPEIDVVYGDQIKSTIMNETYWEAKGREVMYFSQFELLSLFDICLIGSQPLWRSSIHTIRRIYFEEKLEISGDHDFYLRVAKANNIQKLPIITGTFYKPLDKSNKEAENEEYRQREGHTVTLMHMVRYVHGMSPDEKKQLLKRFWLNVRAPYIVMKSWHYILRKVCRNHILSLEARYLFVILILVQNDKKTMALHLGRKLLKNKTSMRMDALMHSLENNLCIEEITFI
jgi:glycosyltransferase involved in cell wall biosynthesis